MLVGETMMAHMLRAEDEETTPSRAHIVIREEGEEKGEA